MKRKANEKIPATRNADSRLVPVSGKLSINEVHEMEKKVLFFAKGNRSLYVRAALLNYKPKKEDFK